MTVAALPLVSVVIPVRDNWCLTRQCLESLCACEPGDRAEVVLVDNGSTDATTVEAIGLGTALFGERFRLLRRDENTSFGAGVNAGAALSRGQFLFLLNNDTILGGEVLGPLIEALEADPKCAAVGPLLLYPGSDRVQHLGIAVAHSFKFVHLYRFFPAGHPVVRRQRRFQAITAAAFLIRRELFLARGGLFEGFVNGMEDIDLCAVLSAEGFHFKVVVRSVICHLEGSSLGRFDQDRQNSRLLEERTRGLLHPDLDRFAVEDGFDLRFTPWLDPFLVPNEEWRNDLEARATDDFEVLFALLEECPCWERGYDLLAGLLGRANAYGQVLAVRVRQAAFLPGLGTLAALEAAALAAVDEVGLARARIGLAQARQAMRYAAQLRETAQAELLRAREAGNAYLAGVFKAWLAQEARR